MQNNQLEYLLENAKYIFAKTMPYNPHYYTLRTQWTNNEWNDTTFVECVMYIRKFGISEKFKGKDYILLYTNNYAYWTMGNPIELTKLINRKKINVNTYR